MKRTLLVCLIAMFTHTVSATAADHPLADAATVVAPVAAAAVAAPQILAAAVAVRRATSDVAASRSPMLLAMYGTAGLLQAYDGFSTLKAVAANHVELNPMMAPLVQHPGLVIAVKAAMTIATISAAENLWRNNHHKQAMVMLIVSNGLMAAVSAHNAMVLRGQRS
jgi:hypothetical protein